MAAKWQVNRYAYMVLYGTSQGKILFGRPSHGWEHSITLEIEETGLGGV
jgi:hypothetical protein